MKAFGLQTFIWQNNFKSLALMLIFPIIILFLVIGSVFTINSLNENKDEEEYKTTYSNYYTEEDVSALDKTIHALPAITSITFSGVGLWFLIAFASHKSIILKMTNSKPISRQSYPKVYNTLENLCISRGIPTPKLFIIPDASINAFASGLTPKKSYIGLSSGAIEKLTDKELEAILAHELTHIINRDIRLMLVAIVFVGIIQTLAQIILRVRIRSRGRSKNKGSSILLFLMLKLIAYILGFFVSVFVQAAISRKREYLADAGSVELTKTSDHLVSALRKIEKDPYIEAIQNQNVAQMFIGHPTKSKGLLSKLFATHPPIETRIEALKMIS